LKRLVSLLVAALLAASGLSVILVAPAEASGALIKVHLRAAIEHLPVSAETRRGYDRDKFQIWIDADRDCQDTRDEVLAAESLIRVRGCDIQQGKWVSYYDHKTFRRSSGMDIDHLVPLAEAWDSGAKKWNADTRKRYANDLQDPRTLVAVSAHANRSKGDRDPSEWMPQYGKCKYLAQWVAVKIRWRLKVDRPEKRALARRAAGCTNVLIKVRHARIKGGTQAGGSGTGGGGSTGGGGGLDPRFSTCTEAIAHGYGPYYRHKDREYPWYEDRDNDGIVCE
jgi:hypothetical protein